MRVSWLKDPDTLLSFDGSTETPLHSNVCSVGVLAEVVVPPGGLFRLGRFNDLDAPPSLDRSSEAPSEVVGEPRRTLRGNESQKGKQTNLREHGVCSCAGRNSSDNQEMLFPLFCL